MDVRLVLGCSLDALPYALSIWKVRVNVETNHEVRGREPFLLRIHPDLTQLTNLGRTTLYHEIASGRLRAVRIGRAVRVRRDDLETWLDQQTDRMHGDAGKGNAADGAAQ